MRGSIKNKVTASEIIEERANCDFDQTQLKRFFYHSQATIDKKEKVIHFLRTVPEIANSHHYYEMTNEERLKDSFRRLHFMAKTDREFFIGRPTNEYYWAGSFTGQPSIGLH